MQCVYRFIDLADGKVKYIGIVFGENRTLKQRTYEHIRYDKWCENSTWKIEYIEVNSRAEAEALEAHFIAVFNTGEHNNKSKSDWGVNSFFADIQFQWKEYCTISAGKIYSESKNMGDFPMLFRRVGLGDWWREDKFITEIQETAVFGRQEENGRIVFSDGSMIREEDIGKVFVPFSSMLNGYDGNRKLIVVGEPRKPKLRNIDLVSYCNEDSTVRTVKNIMADIVISKEQKECAGKKQRYERAFQLFQASVERVRMLKQMKAQI